MFMDILGNFLFKKVMVDGNCLYFFMLIVLMGKEELVYVLRFFVVVELYLEVDFYVQYLYFEKDFKKCNYSESIWFVIVLFLDYEDVRNR